MPRTDFNPFVRWLTVIALALVCFAATSAESTITDATAPSVAETAKRFTQGILWRIDGPNNNPSYLFGTIHTADPRVLALPEPVKRALDNAHSVTLEAIIDSAAIVTLLESMTYRDGKTLRAMIGDTLYKETQQAYRERNLPIESMDKQKPWAAFLALSTPGGEALDFVLQRQAMAAGKPVHGLETVKEQIDIFDKLSLADQTALLKDAVYERGQFQERLEEMTRAYLARDLVKIGELTEKDRPRDGRNYDALMKQLLTDRNRRMVERMAPQLAEGNAFIAIGAAHLGGRDGTLALLERKGYRVTAIY